MIQMIDTPEMLGIFFFFLGGGGEEGVIFRIIFETLQQTTVFI